MPGRLDGKVCIITGATSGIGEKSVEIFVSEGATVVFSGRRVEEGAAVAENTGADFYQCDVTVEAEVAGLITSTHENYGRIDCLFANAGGPGPTGGIATIDADAFNDCIAVNLNSVLYGMKHVAPIMSAQGFGSIINTTSVAGQLAGYSSSTAYSVAKAAAIHFSQLVAMELGESGVRVNSLSPGAIPTGIFGKSIDGISDDQAEKLGQAMVPGFAKAQPMHRAGKTDDIAWGAVFLASDESSFITGTDLLIDGGLIGGQQWSIQQEGLAKRTGMLNKLAAKM